MMLGSMNLPAAAEPSGPPKSSPFSAVRDALRRLMPRRADGSIKDAIEDAIEEVLEEHEDAAAQQLAPEEKNLLKNVLTFGDITVHDIMTPRTDIQAVPANISLEALKRHITLHRHTRIPVYRETLDQVEGFLHIKDLFPMIAEDQPYDLARVMRPMLFVPPSMRILDLLVRMKRPGTHMAVVVDEYGGTDGLVTLEDLFEEIVGEIQDEHDEEEGPRELTRLREGLYDADARIRIEKLEGELGVTLASPEETEEFDTLAGMIFSQLGRVPARGEVVQHPSGLRFEIMEADARCIRRVRISRG